MTTKEAACAIKDWAVKHGVVHGDRNVFKCETANAAAQAVVDHDLDAVEAVVRNRGVNFVTYDEAARTVNVFTAKAVTAKVKTTLPQSIEDITVVFQQGGVPYAGGLPPPPAPNIPYYIHNNLYACGSSIHVGNLVGAGTLGCLVKDAAQQLYGLTNNHVTGGCNYSEVGLPIIAPGPIDVAAQYVHPFTLGTHANLLTMHPGHPTNVNVPDNSDAAIFRIINPAAVTSNQGTFYDTPTAIDTMAMNMVVEKIGRTTGQTTGTVQGVIAGTEPVSYGKHGNVYFDSFVVVKGMADAFSAPGDSGALVTGMVNGSRKALGIIFAGNPESKLTWVLPIGPILNRMGLTLVEAHNV